MGLIPGLMKSAISGVSKSGTPQMALTDGNGGALGLPSGYDFMQWEADIRRWEQETGISYKQYMAGKGTQAGQGGGQGQGRPPAASQQLPMGQQQYSQRPAALPTRSQVAAGGRVQYGGPQYQQQPGRASPRGTAPYQYPQSNPRAGNYGGPGPNQQPPRQQQSQPQSQQPNPAAAPSNSASGMPMDEWLVKEERERERVRVMEGGGEYANDGQRRL
eukprot:gene7728-899_t